VFEPVKAVTADGAWLFVRAEDGTWAAGHLPTETEVRGPLRSLAACRAYVGSGEAWADLEVLLAHKQGGHRENPAEGCRECTVAPARAKSERS
jgi:hypothetical protein